MSRQVKGVVALLVALLMLTLPVGCGSNQANTGATTAGNETTAVAASTDSSASTQAAETAKEPVTLKILGPSFEKAFPNGIQDDPVAKEIEKRTGITIDWIVGNGISDMTPYLSTMVAGGDMPDIICTDGNSVTKTTLLNSDSVIPLDDMVKTNGPNIEKYASGLLDLFRKINSKNNDGKLYAIGTDYMENSKSPGVLQGIPLIRWDLYKAVGMPKIETLDDLLVVMKQIQDKFPTTDDGKKAYAFSGFYGDWGACMPWYYMQSTLNRVQGAVFDYDGSNMSKINRSTDPEHFQLKAAEFFNKIYKMGMLDPDAATMKFEQYLDKVKQGRVYCDIASWSSVDVYNPQAASDGHPERGFEPVPGFYADKPINLYQSMDLGYWQWYISKNCKNPDRAMDLLDFCYTYEGSELIMNGIEGKDYTMVDGKPVVSDDVINQKIDGKADPDFRIKSGIAKYGPLSGFGWSTNDPKGFPINFMNSIDIKKLSLTEIDKDYCKTLNLEVPYQPWLENKDAERSGKYIALMPPLPNELVTEYTQIINKSVDYYGKNYVKLIFAKDFATELQKYINGQKALGIEKVEDWYIEQFKQVVQSQGQ